MKKYIEIKADTNDADYIIEKSEITDEEIEKLKPVIETIKNFKPYKINNWNFRHNWPSTDYARHDLGEKTINELYGNNDAVEFLKELVPYGECGVHTIDSITILHVTKEIKLL